jgi:hypothetical protein
MTTTDGGGGGRRGDFGFDLGEGEEAIDTSFGGDEGRFEYDAPELI